MAADRISLTCVRDRCYTYRVFGGAEGLRCAWATSPAVIGQEGNTMPNFLIIDGHGATTSGLTFDFRRPAAQKCSLFFYTRGGIDIGVEASNRKITAALGGTVPDNWAEQKESRIGGTIVTDRLLLSKDVDPATGAADWVTPVPAAAASATVQLADARIGRPAVPLECHFTGATTPGDPRTATTVVAWVQDGNPGQLLLSRILGYFSTQPYTVIWAPCRGY